MARPLEWSIIYYQLYKRWRNLIIPTQNEYTFTVFFDHLVFKLYVPVCVLLWMLSVDFWANRFRHTSHWYGRSPVWVRLCISKYCLHVNAAGHWRHWNGLPWTACGWEEIIKINFNVSKRLEWVIFYRV